MVASLPPAWREQADRVGQRLHVDPIDWYRAPDTPRFLREAADSLAWACAVLRSRAVSVISSVKSSALTPVADSTMSTVSPAKMPQAPR